ncbi:MAG: LUD domain-containing protein [Halobacteriaceae archaeon]
MTERRRDRAARIHDLLETEGDAVAENTKAFNAGRYEAVTELEEYEGTKHRAREIKADAIERLPELITTLTDSVEANGGHVHRAADAADARQIITDIVDSVDGDTVVKSKSMTSEELEVNDALAADGVDVWETDLGEFVIQLADEAPSHIVAPAIHRSREDIATLFEATFDLDSPPETAADLVGIAREFLTDRIAEADVGMTGANFLVADTGTLALVTSEGNARKTVADTDVHIAVAGVEKIIPTVADLHPFVELLARSGTGQSLTSYLTLLTPPTATPSLDGDETIGTADSTNEFHLVLLDNGRMAMRDDPQLRETLYCVRCSACLNSCANFQHVGGHAFGGDTYSGGIGTAWEAGVHSLDSAGDCGDYCTGCTRCVNQCPVEIDIPWLNQVVRDRINHRGSEGFDWVYEGLVPDDEPGGLDRTRRVFGNVETLARLGSATAPLSNWVADRELVRLLLDRVLGIDARRPLPTFERETLRDWFADRGPAITPAAVTREAVVYPDVYTNHVAVDRGKAAVTALEAMDVHVHIPAAPESGRAPLSQGMISTAEGQARAAVDAMTPHLEAGRDIVVVEPSTLAMFRRDYDNLLADNPLADASYEVLEYLYGCLENGADIDALDKADGSVAVAYHPHCQQRTLGLDAYTTSVLERAGYDVTTTTVECCGMAGSFGYKSEFYELSMAVGDDLTDEMDADSCRLVASGTSCLEQIEAVFEQSAVHPVELLAP